MINVLINNQLSSEWHVLMVVTSRWRAGRRGRRRRGGRRSGRGRREKEEAQETEKVCL